MMVRLFCQIGFEWMPTRLWDCAIGSPLGKHPRRNGTLERCGHGDHHGINCNEAIKPIGRKASRLQFVIGNFIFRQLITNY
jgi:hypothetical protein